jgi:hypothetical protein
MSMVRSAAQTISEFVVRHTSAGCVEWAEALAREADFIENDWKALTWSLGSLRVLLDRRPAPIRTMEDVQPLIKKFVEQIDRYNPKMSLFTAALWVCLQIPKVFGSGSASRHAGAMMLAAGWAVMGASQFFEMRRKQKMVDGKDISELVDDYRVELERVAGIRRRPLGWLGLAGGFCMIIGALTQFHERVFFYVLACLLLFVLVAWILARRTARRRLAELDELLATGSGAR